jgi:hypothetical protein
MIKAGNMQAVEQHIIKLGVEIKRLVKTAFEISYWSRGAWSYHSVLGMSQAEREIATEFINERLKVAAKSPHPVY